MATTEEIARRVQEADATRSERRAAAAKRVGELAQQRATVAEQLSDIERELGDVLAESSDVIEIDELSRFTDVPAADLTRWLDGRKASRTKRKRSTAGVPATKKDASGGPSGTRTPAASQTPTAPEPAVPRADTVNTPERVTAAAT